ncbi:hypothetical protein [Paraflavitalea sp. CAU 1676]|uniref:hypothetical protein n=1 Tax=Paraflavitalea sp. CAU 1676 TaxID=3032598 RepID=UPI0023DA663E|nr:hypothetical protein [Paraflavitalea sp. CAU 1676]MDF2187894.1 hypothetical protein [Paraflavitalea sp. CAU 1676]
MKKILLSALILVSMTELSLAQPGATRDSTAIFRWRSAVRRAPVLTGGASPVHIMPRERLCFNMEFDLKITMPSKMVEQCMFVNHTTGVVGMLPPHEDGLVNMLFPELVDFSFQVMSMTGNTYHYHNNKGKNNTIEKWVTTGNSEQNPYSQMAGMFTGAVDLQRKNTTEVYCNGRMRAMAYRFSTSPDMTWYLYGDRFPEKIHPQKFLGNQGVGYLQANEGLYVITEFRTTGYSVRVTNIEVSNACLETSQFMMQEAEFQRQQNANIVKEKVSLDKAARNVSGACAGERLLLINFKKEQANKRELALRQINEGNTNQSNSNAQRNMAALMDPVVVTQQNILETKLEICKAQNGSEKARRNLGCLNTQLGQLMRLEEELRALDDRHRNEPGRALGEKSKLYMRDKPRGCAL